ncbi:two-component sensor histidine kinase, partial [Escherichia coli]|nr:two-component sensor histidine kinase [Escherichia coli]
QSFLSGASMPVLGDDPRSQNKTVFSATPLRQDGELKGYLYIILQGEESNALAGMAWHKALWSTVLWSLLWVALFGLLAGVLIWYWVTRPVKQLTHEVTGLEHDSITAIKQLA